MKKLSSQTEKIITEYKHLPFGAGCETPYFNNRRRGIRGGLRALVGKGTPKEIIEEARILALRNRVSIERLDERALKAFLISQDLGVDCSGLVYHLLNTELHARGKGGLPKHISYQTTWWRKLINNVRPAENINVSVLASPENTAEVSLEEIAVSDLIIMLNTGVKKNYNHVLFVKEVTKTDTETTINYIHSYAWPSDGISGTGVREGTIVVKGKSLTHAIWTEQGISGEHNYTERNAKEATVLSIKRLKVFIP